MQTLTIANTILAQLGGNRFVAMTGSKNFMGSQENRDLQFCVGKNDSGINKCVIYLKDDDTYTVTFYKIASRGLKVRMIANFVGVYADQLSNVFETATGMRTSL